MKPLKHLLTTCTLLALVPLAGASPLPVVQKGFITMVSSDTTFDLDGTHVTLTVNTRYYTQEAENLTTVALPLKLRLGKFLEIDGTFDKRTHIVTAEKVKEILSPPAPINGTAIVDLIPYSIAGSKDFLLRADGYLLLVPASLHPTFKSPLTAISDIHTNVWIEYQGTRRADGIVILDKATFSPNSVKAPEEKLRSHTEFDSAAVTPDMKQGAISKHFLGVDPKRVPAWTDPIMQARVERIGASLIPTYQRALPNSDPTRIDFRFQVVDQAKVQDSLSLDSGIILIPHQIVERLPVDAQLAAVLADGIAEILEKQNIRAQPAKHKMTAADITGAAAGIFIPGAGVATSLINYKVKKVIFTHAQQQSARVSLCLLHDAGYDIEQAPRAWWILGTKPGKDLSDTDLPTHAAIVYGYLADQWQPESAQRQLASQLLENQKTAPITQPEIIENTGKLLN